MSIGGQFLNPGELDQKFIDICTELRPTFICDVGTRDCHDAIRLKTASPSSQVFAFEASPENFFDYCCKEEVIKSGVIPQHMAVSDELGIAIVNIPNYASRAMGGNLQQRGMTSLLKKIKTTEFVSYTVPQTTIDTFFRGILTEDQSQSFAFWIDVEGLALKVLNGMKEVLARTRVLKIELEDVPYYEGQSLSADPRKFLAEHGFVEEFRGGIQEQFDIIFVKN